MIRFRVAKRTEELWYSKIDEFLLSGNTKIIVFVFSIAQMSSRQLVTGSD